MNLKCPKCGGPVIDHAKASTSGFSLKLNTKDSEPDLTEKTDFVKKEQTERKAAFSTDAGYMDMHIYHCPSCGADLMVASTQAATYCSYCGSPSIVYDRLSKELKPSKIIPFKLSEAQALSCIRDRFGHGSYIPPKIRELTVKDIHAIYIPFWLYTSYIRRHVILDTRTNDDHYIYKRDVSCTYENITLDASLKLSNDMSRSLEPYDMNELEDFNISYLSGYYADRYDVPYTALEGIAHSRCQNFLRSEILQSCEYANNIGNLPVERRTYILRFIKNAVIACMIYNVLSVLFLLQPKLYVCFLFPILIDSILMANGIRSYKKYKTGM